MVYFGPGNPNLNRTIMSNDIARKAPNLTPEAHEKAVAFAVDTWKGQMGAGDAADIGIRHATSDVLKKP